MLFAHTENPNLESMLPWSFSYFSRDGCLSLIFGGPKSDHHGRASVGVFRLATMKARWKRHHGFWKTAALKGVDKPLLYRKKFFAFVLFLPLYEIKL